MALLKKSIGFFPNWLCKGCTYHLINAYINPHFVFLIYDFLPFSFHCFSPIFLLLDFLHLGFSSILCFHLLTPWETNGDFSVQEVKEEQLPPKGSILSGYNFFTLFLQFHALYKIKNYLLQFLHLILCIQFYEGVSKSSWTESIMKYMLTTINTHWEATQSVMTAKLTRMTHKIAIQLHLVAENHLQFSVQKCLGTPL
jgi:hypothetical protein